MLNILAIDSITPILRVTASGINGTVTITDISEKQHAETILNIMEKAIDIAGFKTEDTSLMVCFEGPGSFTGLRLSYSTGKAIQLASNCSFLCVQPLKTYAHRFSSWPGTVISVLDAKKNRFYIQLFSQGIQLTDILDIPVNEAKDFIDPKMKFLITGPDAIIFSRDFHNSFPELDISTIPSGNHDLAEIVSLIAENRCTDYTNNVLDYSGPLYVRKSDAETNNKR